MSGMEMSTYLREFLKNEEDLVLNGCEDSDEKEMLLWMYNKARITEKDLARTYSEDEVRELCLRTKVRVRMNSMNCLYDAQKRFGKKKRLENRSQRFVNAMLMKAVHRGMVEPYSDEYVANQIDVNRAETKKDNNRRLDRWHPPSVEDEESHPPSVEDEESIDNDSQTLYDFNEEQQEEELQQEQQQQQQQEQQEEQQEEQQQKLQLYGIGDQEEKEQQQEQQQQQLHGIGDDEEDQQQEQQLLYGIANQQQESQVQAINQCPETQMPESWMGINFDVNSESMSIGVTINTENAPNTQNTEPDYEAFDTQVVVASTQDDEL